MFNRKAKQIATLKSVLVPLVAASEKAVERLQDQQAELVETKDELNANVLVLEGAKARIRVLENANETMRVAFQRTQQLLFDAQEALAEATFEKEDLAALLDEQVRKDEDAIFDAYDPTDEPDWRQG